MSDTAEITRVVNLYIEGAAQGDAAKLEEAFHQNALWFGTMGGTDYAVNKTDFIAMMVEQPGDTGNLTSKIVDIQQVGTAATATVEDVGFWGTLSFTDYFQLNLLGGRWQIVSKSFAHTGGEHP